MIEVQCWLKINRVQPCPRVSCSRGEWIIQSSWAEGKGAKFTVAQWVGWGQGGQPASILWFMVVYHLSNPGQPSHFREILLEGKKVKWSRANDDLYMKPGPPHFGSIVAHSIQKEKKSGMWVLL